MDALIALLPPPMPQPPPPATPEDAPLRVAIIGRPNVGKSSLVNALVSSFVSTMRLPAHIYRPCCILAGSESDNACSRRQTGCRCLTATKSTMSMRLGTHMWSECIAATAAPCNVAELEIRSQVSSLPSLCHAFDAPQPQAVYLLACCSLGTMLGPASDPTCTLPDC